MLICVLVAVCCRTSGGKRTAGERETRKTGRGTGAGTISGRRDGDDAPCQYFEEGGRTMRKAPGTRFGVLVADFFANCGCRPTTWVLNKRRTARGRCPVPIFRRGREGNGGGGRVC